MTSQLTSMSPPRPNVDIGPLAWQL